MKTNQAPMAIQDLVKLGLSPNEAQCYLSLLNQGSAGASEIAHQIHVLPNAVYRLINSLVKNGFVIKLDCHPVKFQAIPPSVAITNFSQQQIKTIEITQTSIISNLTQNPTGFNPTNIEILTGKNALFTRSAQDIVKAKQEVLIISIGEPVPDSLKLANRDAIAKGVKIKMIVHKYNSDNETLLKSWLKMGLEVRYYQDWGYHLTIYDGNKATLSINNPRNTEERISLVIHSQALANALREYFYTLWAKALPIS